MDYQTLYMKTVVELRKLAKDMQVKLPAGVSKAQICEMLANAPEVSTPVPAEAPAEEAPVEEAPAEDAPAEGPDGEFGGPEGGPEGGMPEGFSFGNLIVTFF